MLQIILRKKLVLVLATFVLVTGASKGVQDQQKVILDKVLCIYYQIEF